MDAGLGLVLLMFMCYCAANVITLAKHWRRLSVLIKTVLIMGTIVSGVCVAVIFPMWEASLNG